ncbi:MAG: hypothetical protein NVSMB22_26660 [Chloroflexota bacterium]
MRRHVICLAIVAVLVALPAPVAGAAEGPREKPSIRILSPAPGATIHGTTVTVRVAVSNFELVRPTLLSPANWKSIPLLKGNQGHIHYVLDSLATMVLSRDVVTSLSHTWTNVAPGQHTVLAYLATSQHAPFPGVPTARVRFSVALPIALSKKKAAAPTVRSAMHPTREGAPSIRFTNVRTSTTSGGTTVWAQVTVSNFTLVKPVLMNPRMLRGNRGHIHYVLDSMKNFRAGRDATTALSHPWSNVAPGEHTLIAYLATSQHQRFPNAPIARTVVDIPGTSTRGGGTFLRIVTMPGTGGHATAPGTSWSASVLLSILGGLALIIALGTGYAWRRV